MARRAPAANLTGMDRSLNGGDFRTLARLTGPEQQPALAPLLQDLPPWFRRLVIEQAAWLGIDVPGLPVTESIEEALRGNRAA